MIPLCVFTGIISPGKLNQLEEPFLFLEIASSNEESQKWERK